MQSTTLLSNRRTISNPKFHKLLIPALCGFFLTAFVIKKANCLYKSRFPNLKNTSINHKNIAVLAITNNISLNAYQLAINSTRCYAQIHGYRNLFVDMADVENSILERCNHTDFMFRRHCVTARLAERHPELQFILFIDADMGVVNPNHLIEDYIPENAEIVFYDRIFNSEIAAGSYLFRNSNYSRNFLDFWADYESKLPAGEHGSDNGAIHSVFLDRLRPDLNKEKCQRIWKNSKTYDHLFNFVACFRWLIDGASEFDSGRVRLLKKGRNSWVRDGWLTGSKWSPRDFMFHGWQAKRQEKPIFGSWTSPFAHGFRFDDEFCSEGSKAPIRWGYNSSFVQTEAQTDAAIDSMILNAKNDYSARLKRIQKL
ncbi:hypothetical protein L596_008623 [Steinernema carpocapsae]|uniref:Nucleotide-diphospho-sugar transferase domain-containing protein n=1 Tax=Steinernema carpocapsae TaxID=34508 RepID=A0A4U5PD71_STECR|nr:hypothetical protein L596_008623 [Steinernema carpocapsae]